MKTFKRKINHAENNISGSSRKPGASPDIRLVEKELPDISGIGDVRVDKQNLMDTYIRHKGKCHNTGNWKHPAILMFTKTLNRLEHHTWHYFSKTNSETVQHTICRLTQFSSTRGLSNEMKMKSKLLPFSLIHIWCQRLFCFWFRSLLRLSKSC